MDNSALRARADELLAELDKLKSGLGELQQRLRSVTATVTSDDGLVTATVGPRGQLQSLWLDPRIYRRPDSVQLAATITKTIQAAAAKAQQQVMQTCRPYLPDAEVASHLNLDFTGVVTRLDHELSGLTKRQTEAT